MLCKDCIHARDKPEITNEALIKLKDLTDEQLKELSNEDIDALKAEYISEMEQTMEQMRARYSAVYYCTARNAVVVGNPGVPTQSITSCESFEEKK